MTKPFEENFLAKVHQDDRFSLEQMIEEVIAGTRKQGAITVRFRKTDGWFHGEILWGVTKRDAKGQAVSCSGTLRDVTEEKAVQEALVTANKKLNNLTSITRHDILNQVTVMALYKELVTETEIIPRDIEEWQYLEFIFSAIKTIQQQFAFSKEYQDLGTHPAEWQNAGLIIKLTARDPILSPAPSPTKRQTTSKYSLTHSLRKFSLSCLIIWPGRVGKAPSSGPVL